MKNKLFDLEIIGFCGFYETLLGEYIDDQINYDLENLDDSLSKLKIYDFFCWVDYDSKQYELDVVADVRDRFVQLSNELMSDIYELPTQTPISIQKPPFYNFTTDQIYFKVKVSEKNYERLIGFLRGKKKLIKEVIERHFTSYPGFTSLYENTLDYWLNIPFCELTDLKFSYLYHFGLCVRLFENDNYREHNGKKVDDINEVYENYMNEIEADVYNDLDFNYSDYVDWNEYRKELKQAVKKNKIIVTDDILEGSLYELVDMRYIINEHNELVAKE